MNRLTTSLGTLAITAVAASSLLALGSDMNKEQLAAAGEHCVHGFWVNEQTVLFFAGDAAQLNRDLPKHLEGNYAVRKIVIHPGTQRAGSPWDAKPRDLFADWSVNTYDDPDDAARATPRFVMQIDVWLGSKIKLEDLRIPAGFQVESGGEIEKFVERQQKQAAKVVPLDEVARHAGKELIAVEFEVATAGWSLAPRTRDQPRGPVRLETAGKLPNGGRFYVMLWGQAIGDNEDQRSKELKGQKVRVTGRIQVANPTSASTDYYMTVFDAADVVVK